MKNCDEARILISAYLDEELDQSESETLQKHIEECEDCSAYLDGLRDTVAKVRMIPDVKLPERFHEESIKKLRDRLNPVEFLTPKEINKTKPKEAVGGIKLPNRKIWIRMTITAAIIIGCMFVIGQLGDFFINEDKLSSLSATESGNRTDTNGNEPNDYDMQINPPTHQNGLTPAVTDEGASPYSLTGSSVRTAGEDFVRSFSIMINVNDYDRVLELINTLPGVNIGMSADYSNWKSASITRSIDQANYMYSKDYLRSLGEVENESEYEYRVSSELIDLESRLVAKEAELGRLLEILQKSDTLNYLTTVERRISEAENERDNIKSQILRYKAQVSNCTLHIIVNYKEHIEGSTDFYSYTQRLKEYFTRSVKFLVLLIENIVVFAAMAIVPLLLALTIFVAVRFILQKRGGNHEK